MLYSSDQVGAVSEQKGFCNPVQLLLYREKLNDCVESRLLKLTKMKMRKRRIKQKENQLLPLMSLAMVAK